MAEDQKTGTVVPQITGDDLKDPNATRINQVYTWLAEQIVSAQDQARNALGAATKKARVQRPSDRTQLTGGVAIAENAVGNVRPIPVDISGTIVNFPFLVDMDANPIDVNGNSTFSITATYDPPKPIENFIGVAVYIEAQSLTDPATVPSENVIYFGDYDYNGIENATDETRYGSFKIDAVPPDVTLDNPEEWKVYLVSRASDVRNQLIQANEVIVMSVPQYDTLASPYRKIDAYNFATVGYVTDFALTWVYDASNNLVVRPTWTAPTVLEGGSPVPDPNFAYIDLWVYREGAFDVERVGEVRTSGDAIIVPGPPATEVETWTFYAVSVATNGLLGFYDFDEDLDDPLEPPVGTFAAVDIDPIFDSSFPIWHPNNEVAPTSDPIYPFNRRVFKLTQSYQPMIDGMTEATVTAEGAAPVTRTVTDEAPVIGSYTLQATGGALASDRRHYVCVAAYNASGFSPRSNIITLRTPSGEPNTFSIDLNDITWPAGTWTGYQVFAHDEPHMICWQKTVDGALPTTVNYAWHQYVSTYAAPMDGPTSIELLGKKIIHGGIVGTNLAGVGANYLELGPGIILSDDEFNGRVISVIADQSDGEHDIWNFTITDTILATNQLVVTPDPQVLNVQVQDIAVIRTKATTYTGTTIGDAKFVNGQYPGGNSNDESGLLLRIISGHGRGQVRRIVSNTTTVYTVEPAFDYAPDSDSIFIVEEAAWSAFGESTPIDNFNISAKINIPMRVPNYQLQAMLVMGKLRDDSGHRSGERDSPWREIFILGEDNLGTPGAATIGPVTAVSLTSPTPLGWASNPDYESTTTSVPKGWVSLTYTPPADVEFIGVDVWTKLPAESVEQAVMRGSYAYGGSGNGKAEIEMELPDAGTTVLFHLASKSVNAANPPDFSDSAATEPVVLNGKSTITASITGASISIDYPDGESGSFWGPTLNMNLPTDDTWSWCDWTVEWLGVDAAEVLVAGFSRDWTNPVKKVERGWGIPSDDQLAAGKATFRFRLYLYKNDGTKVLQANPWGNGTPNKDVLISRQTGTTGAENTPNVTIVGAGTEAIYSTNVDGVSMMQLKVQITRPMITVKYGGIHVSIAPAATVSDTGTWIGFGDAPANVGVWTSGWIATPAPGSYKVICQAFDPKKRENTYAAGVTPTLDLTIPTPTPALKLSRTKGKLTNQGKVTEFEGVEVKAPVSAGVWKTVGWIGSAIENASQLNGAHVAGSGIFFVDSVTSYVVGQTVRITHPTTGVYDEFVINSINAGSKYLDAAYFLTSPVSFGSANAYPDNSLVQIVYQGIFGANAWFGGTGIQDAPLWIDNTGNVRLESVSSKHPAIRIDKNGIRTAISNQPNTETPSTDTDGIAVSQVANLENVACLSLSGTSGVRTPYLKLATGFLKALVSRYNNTIGGELQSVDFTTSVQDFLLTGNRDGSYTAAYGLGSPSAGLRGLLVIGTVRLAWKLLHGSRELVSSAGDLNGQYVKHRFFNATYSAAMVKAALREGEIATWYDGAISWVVFKHADGSGNAFKIQDGGFL